MIIANPDLHAIADRLALQDLLSAYCTAVDTLADMDGMLRIFTKDAVFDLSGIGLPSVVGHDGIRGFFEPVFENMTNHAHYWSNFCVDRLDGDEASVRALVTGMGIARDGNSVVVHVRYFLDCVRTAEGWKFKRFYEDAAMPLPKSLTEIHVPD